MHISAAVLTSSLISLKLLEPQFPYLGIGDKMEFASRVVQVENEKSVEIFSQSMTLPIVSIDELHLL